MSKPKNLYPAPVPQEGCSVVRNVYKSLPETAPWERIYALIARDETIRENTAQSRVLLAQGDEKGYARRKAAVGAFIPAALFEGGRRQEHIKSLTGVGMVDFDHVPAGQLESLAAAVASDPHTLMSYRTASGSGLRVLFRYTSQQPTVAYIDAWKWGNEYYAMVTGLPYDEATKDPTRLSFFTHDPDAVLNPEAVPFSIVTNEEVNHELSALQECPEPLPQGEMCADLARRIAQDHIPYVEGRRHAHLLYRAFLMNRMGVESDAVAAALAPDCPRGEREARDIALWVRDHGSTDFGTWKAERFRHDRKRPTLSQKASGEQPVSNASARYATPDEIRAYLTSRGLMRYNSLSGDVEVWSGECQRFEPVNDRTVNSLWHSCIAALGKYARPQDFDREFNSDALPVFDPIADFLGSLPRWDGTDHIGALAARVHTTAGAERFAGCFRKWFVSMVASWRDPKVLNQNILVFIGAQGIYKSTFFRSLLPPALERYFLAKGNSTYVSKDDKLAVSGYALIDFEEIDSMKDADLNALKALVTTEIISERAAYARNREKRPHIASFCGTGNNKTFLTDLTGNRRWLPFEVERIESPYENPIDYLQLYAQALTLIEEGFRYWFTREEDLELEAYKNEFAEPCLEAELLDKYFRRPTEFECGNFYTNAEILGRCSADLRGPLSARRMGMALKRAGYPQRGHKGRHGYVLVERTYEEINIERTNAALALREG